MYLYSCLPRLLPSSKAFVSRLSAERSADVLRLGILPCGRQVDWKYDTLVRHRMRCELPGVLSPVRVTFYLIFPKCSLTLYSLSFRLAEGPSGNFEVRVWEKGTLFAALSVPWLYIGRLLFVLDLKYTISTFTEKWICIIHEFCSLEYRKCHTMPVRVPCAIIFQPSAIWRSLTAVGGRGFGKFLLLRCAAVTPRLTDTTYLMGVWINVVTFFFFFFPPVHSLSLFDVSLWQWKQKKSLKKYSFVCVQLEMSPSANSLLLRRFVFVVFLRFGCYR